MTYRSCLFIRSAFLCHYYHLQNPGSELVESEGLPTSAGFIRVAIYYGFYGLENRKSETIGAEGDERKSIFFLKKMLFSLDYKPRIHDNLSMVRVIQTTTAAAGISPQTLSNLIRLAVSLLEVVS